MLDLIHNREVSDKLLKENVTENTHWLWFSQLKYIVKNRELTIAMCDGSFLYTYEYQGIKRHLLIIGAKSGNIYFMDMIAIIIILLDTALFHLHY